MERAETDVAAPARKALVYGHSRGLIEALPAMLSRAGFEVHVLTSNRGLRRCKNVRIFTLAQQKKDLVPLAGQHVAAGYDLVVAADDATLVQVMQSPLATGEKLRLLPLSAQAGLAHLASKIGLSAVLQAAGVATPAFAVAATSGELSMAAASVGFPLLLKNDFGGGGTGIGVCHSAGDLLNLPSGLRYPLLVQRRLAGPTIDCSAFYRDGELVTFSYSVILTAERGGLGPSILRRYRPHPERDPLLVRQLRELGHALCANGFVSIGAIADENGQLSFFEADMRPNVWTEYSRYFGEDPAADFAVAFATGAAPPAWTGPRPEGMILSYLPRMRLIDIARNSHNCRAYYENYSARVLVFDRLQTRLAQWTMRRLSSWLRARWRSAASVFGAQT